MVTIEEINFVGIVGLDKCAVGIVLISVLDLVLFLER